MSGYGKASVIVWVLCFPFQTTPILALDSIFFSFILIQFQRFFWSSSVKLQEIILNGMACGIWWETWNIFLWFYSKFLHTLKIFFVPFLVQVVLRILVSLWRNYSTFLNQDIECRCRKIVHWKCKYKHPIRPIL